MKALKYLLEKEFKQIVRNKMMVGMILFYPLLLLLIFPWAINFDAKNLNLVVVNHDKGSYSPALISKINASQSFSEVAVKPTYPEAMKVVESGDAIMILEIPEAFSKAMSTGQVAHLHISTNAVDGTQAILGSSYLSSIIRDFSDRLRRDHPKAGIRMDGLQIEPRFIYNEQLDYKTFMLPAFIVMIITLLCGILPALNIVLEKEVGTIQQINVTPIGKFEFIFAKILPYWVIGLLVLTLSIPIISLIYGLFPESSLILVYLTTLLFIIAMTGMGIIVSNYSETLQQGMFVVLFFILILFLISGLFTPITGMPLWSKVIAYLNPLTYYIKCMRLLYLKDISILNIYPELLYISAFGIVLNLWAVISYKKRK